MKTVTLFRHAKSSWSDPKLKDFDRPLAGRGKKAAARMGTYMMKNGIWPDIILCSSAERTRATLRLAMKAFNDEPKIVFEDALYHASSAALLTTLRALPAGISHAMILGHNPGLHALALDLFGSGDHDAMLRITRKFPTAAIVRIEFDIDEWRRLTAGEGRLTLFMTPKALPEK